MVQKFLLNFEMRTIQPQILEIPGVKLNGKATSGKKKFEISVGKPREVVVFFLEILEFNLI